MQLVCRNAVFSCIDIGGEPSGEEACLSLQQLMHMFSLGASRRAQHCSSLVVLRSQQPETQAHPDTRHCMHFAPVTLSGNAVCIDVTQPAACDCKMRVRRVMMHAWGCCRTTTGSDFCCCHWVSHAFLILTPVLSHSVLYNLGLYLYCTCTVLYSLECGAPCDSSEVLAGKHR